MDFCSLNLSILADQQIQCDICCESFSLNAMLLLHKLSQHDLIECEMKSTHSFCTEDFVPLSDCAFQYRIVVRIKVAPTPCFHPPTTSDQTREEFDGEDTSTVWINPDAPVDSVLDEEDEIPANNQKPTEFECVYCRMVHQNISNLQNHIDQMHQLPAHTTSPLPVNIRQPHTKNSRTFQCRHCNETFINRSHYNRHVLTLRNGKPFFCRICISGFDYRGDLIQHKRQNRDCKSPPREKRFLCTFCGKYFEKRDSLTHHTRVHTKERPFHCDKCHRTFANKGTLRDHMNSHLGLKPYVCAVKNCGKAFRLACTLKQHKTNVHEPPSFSCSFCSRMFADKKHMEWVSTDKLTNSFDWQWFLILIWILLQITHANAHRWETISMWILPENVPDDIHAKSAHQNTHRRTAIQMRCLWKGKISFWAFHFSRMTWD